MKTNLFLYFGTALFMSGAIPAAHAQVRIPAPAIAPTNVPGIAVVAAPPSGFNPVTASPAERAQYAVPPMPDGTAAPKAYNEWLKAVSGPQNRVAAPTVVKTDIYNGPVKKTAGAFGPKGNNGAGLSGNVTYPGSSNWSGPSIVYNGTPFAVEAIQGEFVVPVARQAFSACTGGWDYAFIWDGIDGNGSPDVLQAGAEADAYCSGKTTASFYSAWIEWFPFAETRVSSPPINPGDVVFVEVWNVSPTVGYAYFYDFSNQISAEYQLTAPNGSHLVGNSVEWIVERPGVNGGLATLANYTDVSWPLGAAWNYQSNNPTYYYPGEALSVPAPYTLELLTMTDNNGNGISYGSPQNFGFVYFENFGTSHGTGSVAPYY